MILDPANPSNPQAPISFPSDSPFCRGRLILGAAVSPAYLQTKLTRPLPTKDGSTLGTVLDARAYMLAQSKDRERRAQWQRAAELLLAQANVADFSKQVELALFFDARLDLAAR